jgi:hypothetical protein
MMVPPAMRTMQFHGPLLDFGADPLIVAPEVGRNRIRNASQRGFADLMRG